MEDLDLIWRRDCTYSGSSGGGSGSNGGSRSGGGGGGSSGDEIKGTRKGQCRHTSGIRFMMMGDDDDDDDGGGDGGHNDGDDIDDDPTLSAMGSHGTIQLDMMMMDQTCR